MALFTKTLRAVKDFSATMKTAHETHATAKEKILANYIGRMKEEKLREINDVFLTVEKEQKEALRKVLEEDFATAKSLINEKAVADAPGDFIPTLEAIKTLGKNMTAYEIEAYLEKYKSSYIAARAIAEEITKANGMNGQFTIVRPDQMANDVDKVHGQLDNWLRSWVPNSYMSRLMLADANPVTVLADNVQEWLDGGFVRIASQETK